MARLLIVALFSAALQQSAPSQEPKKDPPFKRLVHADLKGLNGSWELKVDLKSGWKGTIDLSILVNGPGGEIDGCCRLAYTAMLTKGDKDRIGLINARAPRQIAAAGIKQGNVLALVSRSKEKKGDLPGLSAINPRPELTTPFKLDGDKLTLDMSKSREHFLPVKLAALDLDFANMQFTRTNKELGGK